MSGSVPPGRPLMCRSRFRWCDSRRPSGNCWRANMNRAAPRAGPLRSRVRFLDSGLRAAARNQASADCLLDLGFLELDMLAHDRVILAHRHLLGLVARILLGHVEKAGVG